MSKEKRLKKMSRKDLLEILILQNSKIQQLEDELKKAKSELENRKVLIEESGSLTDASLKLNKVFEVAQKAADDYLKNIQYKAISNNKKQKQEYNKKVVMKKEIINGKDITYEKK